MCVDQRVECIEELLLRPGLSTEELDVVDQQQVQRVVELLEGIEGLVLIRPNDVRDVLLGVRIAYVRRRVPQEDVVRDGMHQVRLAEPDAAVDEHRVVGSTWVFSNLKRRGTRQLIGLASHEIVEGEQRVETTSFASRRRFGSSCRPDCFRHRLSGSRRRCTRSKIQRDNAGALGDLFHDLLDGTQELVSNPLEDESIRCREYEFIVAVRCGQRLYPGLELLLREQASQLLLAVFP